MNIPFDSVISLFRGRKRIKTSFSNSVIFNNGKLKITSLTFGEMIKWTIIAHNDVLSLVQSDVDHKYYEKAYVRWLGKYNIMKDSL